MSGSSWAPWASVLVAAIAALSAYAAQRAAARASRLNTQDTGRVQMEEEAYVRARAFDTETIRRQDVELTEERAENTALRSEIRLLKEENRELRSRLRNRN